MGRYSPVRVMRVPGSPCTLSNHHVECDCDLAPNAAKKKKTFWPAPFGNAKRPRRSRLACTPSKIDKYSRAAFPLLFLSFNTIYWIGTYIIRQVQADDHLYHPIISH
uniref:Uncharacterized protein n=1 Tax=Plectus sambesii TaxID=2011161 RepID=A0A914XR86_9BILA